MQRTKTLVRIFAMVAVFGLATLALPLAAHAEVRVSIGVGLPVVVAPAPVVVAPPLPAVVYPAPVVVASPPVVVAPPPVLYGTSPVLVGDTTGIILGPGDPPPLVPLVMIQSVPDALPCRTDREGLVILCTAINFTFNLSWVRLKY
jgi:hypothetical protein